jgi:glycosyltransferase involved in cell wall biosynthesis
MNQNASKKDARISVRVGRNVFSWRPQVSVIIPAYNAAEYIGETLQSVRSQKFRDYEVIVVNDGSPDTAAMERVLEAFRENIVYIKTPNRGAGAARNLAIENARADIIAFLDADDVWLPDFLTSQVSFLGKGWDMVYADAALFGLQSPYRRTFMDGAPSEGEVTAASLLDYRCNVITSGTVARKAAILAAGGFEEERQRAHDFHLWVRMAKNGARIGYQKKLLLKYRVRKDNLSGDSISRVEREIDVLGRVRRTIELTPAEIDIVERKIALLETQLQIERGKSFLVKRDFEHACEAFAAANRRRPSLKLTAVALAARFAPNLLLNHYQNRRSAEIGLLRV